MEVNQIYAIINSVSKQMWGKDAVTITDLTGLIQLGNTVFSSATNKDKFLDTLVDRIGKTIISSRPYSPNIVGFMNESFEFGAILQKIYVEPMEAETSTHWGLTNGVSVDQYVISKPTVKQKLFSDIDTWQVKVTIPDKQFKTAFTDPTIMATFIDAIFLAMRNSMELKLEGMFNMCVANFIGEKISDFSANGGIGVINLLAVYNAAMTTTLTAAEALMSQSFLQFATKTINSYVKRMARMSQLFNCDEYKRFTSNEYIRITVLEEFASAVTAYLESDVYHNELVKLPNYTEVPYWQGSGTDFAFANTSAIKINISSTGFEVEQAGIVCLITDVEALGITINDRRSTSAYNSEGEYTNFVEKADVGYFNDMSENGMVFVIASAITTPVDPEA